MTFSALFSPRHSILLLALLWLFTANHALASAPKAYHLSPEVNGQLFRLDKPLSGIEVVRKLSYPNGEEIVDTTTTDRAGKFTFAEKSVSELAQGSKHHESQAIQLIVAKWRNNYHTLWLLRPSSGQQDTTITQKLGVLRCDLTDTEASYILKSDKYDNSKHLLYSVCDIDGTRATLRYSWTM